MSLGKGKPIEDAPDLGFHAVIPKPFTRDHLRAGVERALQTRA